MKIKRKLFSLAILVVITCLVYFLLPQFPGCIPGYDRHIYYPFQSFRGVLLGAIPFSIGDLIYIALGVGLLITLIKCVRYALNYQAQKELLALSSIKLLKTVLNFYLFFIIGWGANYYKPTLRQYWSLKPAMTASQIADTSKAGRKKAITEQLEAFDQFLVDRLNEYSVHYHPLPVNTINERAKEYYGLYTDCRVTRYGLNIKPTLFGYFMERLGTEGYYNPFTGEGQVDTGLPAFTLPFLICHEMAHQAGIGSEEDANLMAYALGTTTPDSTFRYSCYLNIWQYTNNRLYRFDTSRANLFEHMLNKLTQSHLDTLEVLSEKYNNGYARLNSKLYDSYLKMNDQKDGIRSYSNVSASAWQLEKKRMNEAIAILKIP